MSEAVRHPNPTISSEAVKVGILLPARELAMTGRRDGRTLVDLALLAERRGIDSVWTGDSPLARTRMDPFALLGAVSSATTSITVGTAALLAPLRPAALSAHGLASIDQLSEGRLIAAVAAGFPMPETEQEFDAVAMPFTGRVTAMDDAVRTWRAGWSSGPSSEPFVPLPAATTSGPPVWLAGGNTPRAIARTAALYDGWLPFLPDAEDYATAWRAIRTRADETGRTITPAHYATVNIGADAAAAEREMEEYVQAYYRLPLGVMRTLQAYRAGSAHDVAAWLRRFVEAGARHLVLRLASFDPVAQIEQVASDLLPALRAA